MPAKYVYRFKKMYYETELVECKRIRFRGDKLEVVKSRHKQLNRKAYKSELWFIKCLTKHKLNYTIYRNYPILNKFYADFYIKELRLAIEVDGSAHINNELYDKKRDGLFYKRGIATARVRHGFERDIYALINVLKHIENNKNEWLGVLDKISKEMIEKSSKNKGQ